MLTNLNETYIIKDTYLIGDIEYCVVDFPKLAERTYWTKNIWPEIRTGCNILASGTTAIIIRKSELEKFDQIIDKHKEMFTKNNRMLKNVKIKYQLGLLEKTKGYYPEIN